MSITEEQYKLCIDEGLVLTPVNPNTKKPKAVYQGNHNPDGSKKFEWFYGWTKDEIMKAESIACYHRVPTKDGRKKRITGAVDPDDKTNTVHKYMSIIPATMTVTKIVNGSPIQTQRIYKQNGKGFPKLDYGGASKDDGKILETLQSGISVIHSKEKDFSLTKPVEVDPVELEKKLKLACFFSEVEKVFPKQEGGRDLIHLRLAGALARLDVEDYPTELLERFHEQLCVNIGDDEIKNRINKISYQRKQLEDYSNEVLGIPELCKSLGVQQLPAYDLLKKDIEDPKEGIRDYPMKDFNDVLNEKYPQPLWITFPIIREKTVTQISGDYGSGKTHLGLKLALDISQGYSFLPEETFISKGLLPNGYTWYRSEKKRPILYVEGELPATDIRDRVNSLAEPFIERVKKFNAKEMYFLTLDDLEIAGFKHGFEPIAISNDEEKAKRNRKMIERLIEKIRLKHGVYPVLFLDNITALTTIDENKSTDWSGLMMWLMLLKTKGVVIIFFHHVGKSTGTASGSNLAQRLVDTHIILRRLPEKAKFEDHDGVQCSVHFDKFRNFGGRNAKPFMLLCNKQGNWTKYNMLMDKKDFKILELYKEGKTVKMMCAIDQELKEATVYRRIDAMKKEGIIHDEKQDRKSSNY